MAKCAIPNDLLALLHGVQSLGYRHGTKHDTCTRRYDAILQKKKESGEVLPFSDLAHELVVGFLVPRGHYTFPRSGTSPVLLSFFNNDYGRGAAQMNNKAQTAMIC